MPGDPYHLNSFPDQFGVRLIHNALYSHIFYKNLVVKNIAEMKLLALDSMYLQYMLCLKVAVKFILLKLFLNSVCKHTIIFCASEIWYLTCIYWVLLFKAPIALVSHNIKPGSTVTSHPSVKGKMEEGRQSFFILL